MLDFFNYVRTKIYSSAYKKWRAKQLSEDLFEGFHTKPMYLKNIIILSVTT